MQSQLVFQDEKERSRLQAQERLLVRYEESIFSELLKSRTGLCVLDIGCNDGEKTRRRFSSDAISKVVGLDVSSALIARAQEKHGAGKFSFYLCDVESENFASDLKAHMEKDGIEKFDIIYLSFVLMHIKNIQRLLWSLKKALAQNGTMVILEANDSASYLSGDEKNLLGDFLGMLAKDPLAGSRDTGSRLETIVKECGYRNVRIWHDRMSAPAGDIKMKKDIFEVYFTYLSEDVKMLCAENPQNTEYLTWSDWLKENFEQLRKLVLSGDTQLSIGVCFMTCNGEAYER